MTSACPMPRSPGDQYRLAFDLSLLLQSCGFPPSWRLTHIDQPVSRESPRPAPRFSGLASPCPAGPRDRPVCGRWSGLARYSRGTRRPEQSGSGRQRRARIPVAVTVAAASACVIHSGWFALVDRERSAPVRRRNSRASASEKVRLDKARHAPRPVNQVSSGGISSGRIGLAAPVEGQASCPVARRRAAGLLRWPGPVPLTVLAQRRSPTCSRRSDARAAECACVLRKHLRFRHLVITNGGWA